MKAGTSRRIEVWVPGDLDTASLGELPQAVNLHRIPSIGPLPAQIKAVEFLVPPYGSDQVRAAMPHLRNLQVVQLGSSGVDWIENAVPIGVTLCNAVGTRHLPVAEWVIGAILDSYKDLSHFRRQQTMARWAPRMPRELAGSKALIVGYGSIGRAVEERLRPFGVDVTRVASRPRDGVRGIDAIDELLLAADIVIVLLPATPETIALIGRDRLAMLKDGSLLVNAGRGGVIEPGSLAAELESGRLRAALDVTEPEPLPADSPLWQLPNVLITPHIAGDSPAAEDRVGQLIGSQIRRHVSRQPLLNVVR